ncbi:hypothetical protein [Massilia orientalis]|uniref:Uncharacterized protein n=1 Tax=Massilia orientalis TaxID=3050128 RepID=A0ACC7ME27_9BURK|nr:hypothetical protein [Massilia sp. YIM B02787]
MSRYRNYGQARGTRTYLSRREEFGMSEEEKHAAYLRRKTAEEAAKKAGVGRPLMPYMPAGPTACEVARAMAEEQVQATAPRAVSVAPAHPVPQSGDLFAGLESEEEEEELGEVPAP